MKDLFNAPDQASGALKSMQTTLDKLKRAAPVKKAQDAIENFFQERDNEGEVIQQSPVWMRATTYGLMGTAAFAVGWLALAKTDEVVTVSGKLEPLGSVQEIQMPLGGIASDILVKDGEEVKAGQVVMRLDAETNQQRLDSLQQNQILKQRQLTLKQTELNQYLLLNNEEEKMLERNLELQNEILSRYKILNEDGAASELQYLQQQNKVAEVNGKLNQIRVDRLRQQAAQNQQIQQLKAELEELETKITETTVNLRYQVLRSPVNGIVFDLQPRGEGYAAQGTDRRHRRALRAELRQHAERAERLFFLHRLTYGRARGLTPTERSAP